MHALGCSAEEALQRMRQISQARNMKVTEVAARIIESRGRRAGDACDGTGGRSPGRQRTRPPG